tara:strand:- start:393 stop:572 length:180 start_codon:yes stop_codon:yes gene_type:complete
VEKRHRQLVKAALAISSYIAPATVASDEPSVKDEIGLPPINKDALEQILIGVLAIFTIQ